MLLYYAVVGACFSLSMRGEGARINNNRFHTCSFCIINCALRATGFTIEHGDHSCAAINHPNIPCLVATSALCLADGTHNISIFKHSLVSLLPCFAHALFKAGMRYCAYQVDCGIGSLVLEDDLCCYDVHAPSDATDESAETTVDGPSDLAL